MDILSMNRSGLGEHLVPITLEEVLDIDIDYTSDPTITAISEKLDEEKKSKKEVVL